MMTFLLVVAGGAAGAVLRLGLDVWLRGRLPWGILAANVLGSFLLGLLHGTAPDWLVVLGGTGFCGALTTWSTLASDTVRLSRAHAVPNLLMNLILGLSAAGLGWWLAP